MRIRKYTFRYIEQEIYDFHKTKRHLDDITKDIIFRTPEQHEIRGTDIPNPTYASAYLLCLNKIINNGSKNLQTVESAFNALDETKSKVLKDKYWERPHLSWSTVADLHFLERRTLYNWRTALIIDIAKMLGLI